MVSAPTFSSASESGNIVTFTTSAAHKLSRGEPIVVSGCSISGYNGEFVLGNTISSTTFTVYNSATGLGSPTGCVITPENDSEVADWANNLKPYSDKCPTGVLCGVVSNPAVSASGLNNIVFVDGVTYPLTDVGLTAAINALPAASSWSHCGTIIGSRWNDHAFQYRGAHVALHFHSRSGSAIKHHRLFADERLWNHVDLDALQQ